MIGKSASFSFRTRVVNLIVTRMANAQGNKLGGVWRCRYRDVCPVFWFARALSFRGPWATASRFALWFVSYGFRRYRLASPAASEASGESQNRSR